MIMDSENVLWTDRLNDRMHFTRNTANMGRGNVVEHDTATGMNLELPTRVATGLPIQRCRAGRRLRYLSRARRSKVKHHRSEARASILVIGCGVHRSVLFQ
jgi:hypothetical protein